MSHRFKCVLLTVGLCALLASFLGSCSTNMASNSIRPAHPSRTSAQPSLTALASACPGTLHPASATDSPSLSVPRSIYFGTTHGDLLAINAQAGTLRWCIHLNNPVPLPSHCNGQQFCPPLPPLLPLVGTPAVVDGVVYVCTSVNIGTGILYALNASDGAMRWHTQTGCMDVDTPFNDRALPLVSDGVVYSGFYAVRAQDGQSLWKVRPYLVQGGLSFMALSNGTIYAYTNGNIFALDAANGSVLWHYPPYQFTDGINGPLAVSNNLLVVGTSESVNQPETSAVYALNAQTGSLRWYSQIGNYAGATFINKVVYISSGDGYLDALDTDSGKILWRRDFVGGASSPALVVNGVLYFNSDGAYALRSDNGNVLWHTPLGTSPSVDFLPSVVVAGTDYLASENGSGYTTLYTLNASTGAENWHSRLFPQLSSSLAVV